MTLCLFGFLLCFFPASFLAGKEAVQEKIAELKYENDILNARVKLGKSGKFYLIADLPEKKIHLMIKNISLKEYPVEDIEIGKRVLFFFPLWSSKMETVKVSTRGAIYPSRVVERFQIIPPEEKEENQKSEEEPPSMAKPPEAKRVDVPHIFRLKFRGGFCLEIHSTERDEESPGLLSRMRSRLRSKGSNLLSIFRGEGAFKVKCFLSAEEARSFYRIVPDDISMLLLVKPLR